MLMHHLRDENLLLLRLLRGLLTSVAIAFSHFFLLIESVHLTDFPCEHALTAYESARTKGADKFLLKVLEMR